MRRTPQAPGAAGLHGRRTIFIGLLTVGLVGLPAGAATSQDVSDQAPRASSRPASVLDVPFVPQTPDLCGGAAVAMVARYWGGSGVAPSDFAHLVSDAVRGIPSADLRDAAESLGWRALAFRGDIHEARLQVERGRPLIALIRVAPDRFHYVVLVGWLHDRFVLHDPARGPFQAIDLASLSEAWEAAGGWSLLLLPDAAGGAAVRTAERREGTRPDGPCAGLIARGVALARDGASAPADVALEMAEAACPGDPVPIRERAGLRLRDGRSREAAELAERALALDPTDLHAARTLAAARYLAGERREALAAWNRAEAPRIDLVQTEGARRVPPPTLLAAVGLRPGEVLSPGAFGRAERRLAHFPAAGASRLAYHPLPDGSVRVVAAIHEPAFLPAGPLDLLATGLRTLAEREARLRAASPFRGGELWTATGRFEQGRPAASLELAAPAAWPAAGVVWRVEGAWERETYRRPGLASVLPVGSAVRDSGDPSFVEERFRGLLEASRWETESIRWRLGGALDRWEHRGAHVALSGSLTARLMEDRLALLGGGEAWAPLSSGAPFATGRVAAEWRSRAERRGLVWSARTGLELAGSGAPLGVWPGAGEGRARLPYLRAHPLLSDGELTGPAFGRALVHGGAEGVIWAGPTSGLALPARAGLAAFADFARPGEGLPGEPGGVLHVDAGLGLRLAPWAAGGVLRLDFARGLSDRATAWTAGWETGWPRLDR